MVQLAVPDFFQEESADALRAQVDWLVRETGVDSAFFEKLLDTERARFSRWRESSAVLPPGGEDTLRELWRTVLHLLSFLSFDLARLRAVFQQTMPLSASAAGPSLAPPWSGTTLKGYLERTRADGLDRVADWVTGLRFGDPYRV